MRVISDSKIFPVDTGAQSKENKQPNNLKCVNSKQIEKE